jgi:hypothetical protein
MKKRVTQLKLLSPTLRQKVKRQQNHKLNKELNMFNQVSLFTMLLTPVFAYLAGAVIFSVVECLRKDPTLAKYNNIISYRNGH